MCHMLDMLCAAILVAGTVGMLQVLRQLFSTCFDGNVSSNETSFALVLARFVLYLEKVEFLLRTTRGSQRPQRIWEKYPPRWLILEIGVI